MVPTVIRDAEFSGSPWGAGFVRLRRIPAGPPSTRRLREPKQGETPRLRAPRKWESVQAAVREQSGVGEERRDREKAGGAGLEVSGLECHTEKCGQRKDISKDGLCRSVGAAKGAPGKIRKREEMRERREGRPEPLGAYWGYVGDSCARGSPQLGGDWEKERQGKAQSGSPSAPVGSRLRASRVRGSSHLVSAISGSALRSVRVLTGLESCVPPQVGAEPDPCHLLL